MVSRPYVGRKAACARGLRGLAAHAKSIRLPHLKNGFKTKITASQAAQGEDSYEEDSDKEKQPRKKDAAESDAAPAPRNFYKVSPKPRRFYLGWSALLGLVLLSLLSTLYTL